MISSTRTTRVNEYYTCIPQYVMIYFYMQRFKFIDFMVIELCKLLQGEEEEEEEKDGKNVENTF